MKLINWQHGIIDLSKTHFTQNPSLSIIANAVDYLNIKLANEIDDQRIEKVIELGCGFQSVFKNCLPHGVNWDGIDVIERASDGRKTIATKIASVGNIPFEDETFDIALANQSMEHWYEYGVTFSRALNEINRVLKLGGYLVINVPIHLHGHKFFIQGSLKEIVAEFEKAKFEIDSIDAVIDTTKPNYEGWKLCRLPTFLLGKNPEKTSFCIEFRMLKIGNCADESYFNERNRKISKLQRHLNYGLPYLVWKIYTKIRDLKFM